MFPIYVIDPETIALAMISVAALSTGAILGWIANNAVTDWLGWKQHQRLLQRIQQWEFMAQQFDQYPNYFPVAKAFIDQCLKELREAL